MHTGYKIFHIYDRQLQLHTKSWLEHINGNNINNKIARTRLQHLQNHFWSINKILDPDIIYKTKRGHNLTNEILNLMKLNNLSITLPENQNILEYPQTSLTPIEKYVPTTWYNKNRSNLRNRKLLYIEQLTNYTQSKLLNWIQVNTYENNPKQGKIPKWFTELSNHITTPDIYSNHYKITIPNLPINKLKTLPNSSTIKPNKIQYIATEINNQTYIGKKKAIINSNNQQIKTQHYIPISSDSPITKCTGCHLNNQNINPQTTHNHTCIQQINTNTSILVPTTYTTQSSKIHSFITGRQNRLLASPNTIQQSLQATKHKFSKQQNTQIL